MAAVQLAVPFTYEAAIRRGGKRQLERVFVRSQATTRVEIVDDAPVAARIRVDPPSRQVRDRSMLIDLRHLDGGFWRPTHLRPAPKANPELVTAEASHAAPIRALEHAWSDMRHLGVDAMTTLESLDGVEEIVWQTHDKCRGKAEEAGQEARMIAGVLHRRTSEPVYAMTSKGGIASGVLSQFKGRTPAAQIWRADNQDPLLEYLVAAPADRQEKLLELIHIDLLRPDLLTWDRDRETAIEAVDVLVKRLHADLMTAPSSVVQGWIVLRDLASNPDRDDDAILDAARLLAIECRDYGLVKRHLASIEADLALIENASRQGFAP